MKWIKEFWGDLSLPQKFAYSWVLFLFICIVIIITMNWSTFGFPVFIVASIITFCVVTIISIGAVLEHLM